MEKVEKIKNIQSISLVFFLITGLLHFGSAIFISNQLFLKESLIINKTMDIPFVISGLLYAFSSLRLNIVDPNQEHKVLDIILISGIIIALIGLIVINLAFPDLQA